MTRPADWTALGYGADPVPGDPDRVSLIGRMYIGTAESIERAALNLEIALRDDFGQAETIDAIREVAGDVASRILRAHDRYRGVGDAMVAYAPALRTAQTDSASALQKAIDAHGEGRSARSMIDYYEDRIADPATPPANLASLQASLQTWRQRSTTATTDAASAAHQCIDAIAARDSAALVAIEAIREVEGTGELNDSPWDDIVQWVQENKEMIDLVVDIVGYVATAVMVVAMFIPGLNVIVGLVATIAAVVTLLNTALQVAAGTMGPAEAMFNVAMAALTFVGGRAIGQSLKNITQTAKQGVAAGIKGGAARAGLRGVTRQVAASRVTTAINVSRPQQLAVLDRLRYLTLDLREVSALRNLANIETAMGNMTTAGRQAMKDLNTLAAQAWTFEGGMFVAGQFGADASASLDGTPHGRVGDDW
ncbi:hypothetical protein [Microbacterium ulmi]|uniref:Uncharacterized protein n=1 Tax=Microbacterium ulmi TaxID=179095 RepID=A0A7Y2M0S4_9MICO|nr:hypothetical protein [Microbacterium ulmi]NII70103.1 hypothetical protein [Microbacterium ulmi]NNH04355.1 hypothetical protein [Microbacterium ulmi]